jgi:hypothetical protein
MWREGTMMTSIYFCLEATAMADPGPLPVPLVEATWIGNQVSVTSAQSFDIRLEFRVEHGDEDWYEVTDLVRVGIADPALVTPTWPDISLKGDLSVAPGTITGFVRIFAVDGTEIDGLGIPARLVFLDDPTATYAPGDLDALLPTTLVVGAGFALTSASPQAVLDAAIKEVAP